MVAFTPVAVVAAGVAAVPVDGMPALRTTPTTNATHHAFITTSLTRQREHGDEFDRAIGSASFLEA
jgi:hypothetical protein